MSGRELWEFRECHEAVTRDGIDQPCDKSAVALRIDPEEGHPYPVCARHARNGGSHMVPLADVVRPAVARAEAAEQALQRVRELVDQWATFEVEMMSRPVIVQRIRRALDGTP